MTEPEGPFPHERDQPKFRDTWTLPPLAVWVSLVVILIFSVTFILSLKEALVTIQKTPVSTRVFYWVTYGSFYAWPAITMAFMLRGKYWAFMSSQFILILLMLGLGFLGISAWAQGGPKALPVSLSCGVGLLAVIAVFLWNSGSRRVSTYYRPL
jgi:hypothetical protein